MINNNITAKRRSNLIKELLANIVNNVINDKDIGYISITDVNLSNDLSICNVFYTILDNSSKSLNLANKVLEENKKEIRMELAHQIKHMKQIPQLFFKYDVSLTYGENIDKILEDIVKE